MSSQLPQTLSHDYDMIDLCVSIHNIRELIYELFKSLAIAGQLHLHVSLLLITVPNIEQKQTSQGCVFLRCEVI